MRDKLNMVVGAFFGEMGNHLAAYVTRFCSDAAELAERLCPEGWGEEEYRRAFAFAEEYRCTFVLDRPALAEIRAYLLSRRPFVLGLLRNPNLEEGASFTELLRALDGVADELTSRGGGTSLAQTEVEELNDEFRRLFPMLIREWLSYLYGLKAHHPAMYSLALRMNPFVPEPRAAPRRGSASEGRRDR